MAGTRHSRSASGTISLYRMASAGWNSFSSASVASTGAVGAGAHPGTPGSTARPARAARQTSHPKPGNGTISNQTSRPLND